MLVFRKKDKILIELNVTFNLDNSVLYSLLILYTYANSTCMLE